MKKFLTALPQALILIGLLLMLCPLILEIWDKGWDMFQFNLDYHAANARKKAMFWKYWHWYAGAFSLWGVGLLTLWLGDRR